MNTNTEEVLDLDFDNYDVDHHVVRLFKEDNYDTVIGEVSIIADRTEDLDNDRPDDYEKNSELLSQAIQHVIDDNPEIQKLILKEFSKLLEEESE